MSDKLDRLVSEKVMGWTVRESDPDDNDYERYSSGWAVSRWNPSTDIAAAWEVRTEMKRRGFQLHLEDFGNRWRANFSRDMLHYWRNSREHSNECVAICLAALELVGAVEEEIQEAMR